MQKITPFLWFDDTAEEAASFYVSVFGARRAASGGGESKIGEISRYGESGPGEAGSVMTVTFQLDGQEFTALNGGPAHATFSEAISFFVNCETQDEVDQLWSALTEGGQEVQCGWLTDKYGLSWQIIPKVLPELLSDPDPERSQRVMKAMLEMKKIDIAGLQRAAEAA
jgi:predicted 3-demethylubiquinone-9 3-methyltransferase (glyoxalase superfamily)